MDFRIAKQELKVKTALALSVLRCLPHEQDVAPVTLISSAKHLARRHFTDIWSLGLQHLPLRAELPTQVKNPAVLDMPNWKPQYVGASGNSERRGIEPLKSPVLHCKAARHKKIQVTEIWFLPWIQVPDALLGSSPQAVWLRHELQAMCSKCKHSAAQLRKAAFPATAAAEPSLVCLI